MRSRLGRIVLVALTALGLADGGALAQATSPAPASRVALVVALETSSDAAPTAANDAGLMAETLAASGFDVTAARDIDGDALRRVYREFLGKASALGPQGIAFVYVTGRAFQAGAENYLLPIETGRAKERELPEGSVRLADLTRSLAAVPLLARIIVLDAASARVGAGAPGLALAEPERGTLVAFNAAPDTNAEISAPPYGTYAKILSQTMRKGGIPVEEVFARTRVAVNTATRGASVPWNASRLTQSFQFFDRAPDAPAIQSVQIPFASLRTRPLRNFSPEQAYDVVVGIDDLTGYQDYLTVFPDSSLARRVRLILAFRRQALFWREAVKSNTPAALWTYLRRYPHGPHTAEAEHRVAKLGGGQAPPAGFALLAFSNPPPPTAERVLIERDVSLGDPELEPPPQPPVFLLPPTADETPIPPPSPAPGLLPVPGLAAIPFVKLVGAPGAITPPHGTEGAYPQLRTTAIAPEGSVTRPVLGQPPSSDPASTPESGANRLAGQSETPIVGTLRALRRKPRGSVGKGAAVPAVDGFHAVHPEVGAGPAGSDPLPGAAGRVGAQTRAKAPFARPQTGPDASEHAGQKNKPLRSETDAGRDLKPLLSRPQDLPKPETPRPAKAGDQQGTGATKDLVSVRAPHRGGALKPHRGSPCVHADDPGCRP